MKMLNLVVAIIIYLPMVAQPGPRSSNTRFYGLAYAPYDPGSVDLALIGVSWYYAWSPLNPAPNSTAEFVPMLKDGYPFEMIPSDFTGPILVGNEPDNIKQINLTPAEMLRRFEITRAQYPKARLVCCGVLSYHEEWMEEFIALGGKPDAWHIHAYIEGPHDVDTVIEQLIVMGNVLDHQATWVTEFNSMDGDLDDFAKLTIWMEQQAWIERIAPFTNRQPHTGEWWEVSSAVELVSPAGQLTSLGDWYASRIQAGH